MNSSRLVQYGVKNRLKPGWLLLWWAIAALLFTSWLQPSTRAGWDILDAQIFYWLNGTLESGRYWQGFWALVNWRPFDIVAAGIILLISFFWIYKQPRESRINSLAGLSLLLLIILATRFSAAFLLYLTEYQRYSPSITLQPSYRLSELVVWIEAKDYHKDCFPGDHGYVIISCVVFFFVKAGRKWGWLSLVLLSPFMLPRLVSGAHWLTDILVGSGSMALISLPLLVATPFYAWGQSLFSWIYKKIFGRLLAALQLI